MERMGAGSQIRGIGKGNGGAHGSHSEAAARRERRGAGTGAVGAGAGAALAGDAANGMRCKRRRGVERGGRAEEERKLDAHEGSSCTQQVTAQKRIYREREREIERERETRRGSASPHVSYGMRCNMLLFPTRIACPMDINRTAWTA